LSAGYSHGVLFVLAAVPLLACAGALLVLLETRRRDPRTAELQPASGMAH
jgi:hypothetical protein